MLVGLANIFLVLAVICFCSAVNTAQMEKESKLIDSQIEEVLSRVKRVDITQLPVVNIKTKKNKAVHKVPTKMIRNVEIYISQDVINDIAKQNRRRDD